MEKNNKKGLSEVVGYVILIVIAISLSIIVYSWLRLNTPKETTECPEDLSITIKDYICYVDSVNNKKTLNITLKNKGLFDIDGVYIKGGVQSGNATPYPIGSANIITYMPEKGFLHFGIAELAPLAPNKEFTASLNYSEFSSIKRIQIQPFIQEAKTNELILCSKSTVNANLNCP